MDKATKSRKIDLISELEAISDSGCVYVRGTQGDRRTALVIELRAMLHSCSVAVLR